MNPESAPHPIQDPHLAENMAYAEKPYQELRLQAEQLGVADASSEMTMLANRAADITMNGHEALVAPAAETLSPEDLKELANKHPFTLSVYTNSGWGTFANRGKITSTPLENRLIAMGTESNVAKELGDQNVSEIVSTTPMGGKYEKVHSTSDKAQEDAVLVSYETNARAGSKFKYFDAIGRLGNEVKYCLILPQSEADRLIEAGRQDPTVFHELTDTLLQISGAEGSFVGHPKYDEWRNTTEGKAFMAFRHDIRTEPASQAEIVEF